MPITKRITNYCNYTAWNCDAGERVATAKNALSNRCNAIGNIYVSEGFAVAVFTTDYYSIFYR